MRKLGFKCQIAPWAGYACLHGSRDDRLGRSALLTSTTGGFRPTLTPVGDIQIPPSVADSLWQIAKNQMDEDGPRKMITKLHNQYFVSIEVIRGQRKKQFATTSLALAFD